MMHEFLSAHRDDLIERCRVKVAQRSAPKATEKELEHGIPLFLDQLIKTLQMEQTAERSDSTDVSGPPGGMNSESTEMGEAALQHGSELLRQGLTVEQVVHDYGDLCQSITDFAFETDAKIETDEFRTLNRCLDNAIAMAVTEYTRQKVVQISDEHEAAYNEQRGFFAHELRNLLNTATLALTAIQVGNVGMSGATGAVLTKSLVGMRHLIDRSLADVRLTADLPTDFTHFSLAAFIEEVRLSASLEARAKGCTLNVPSVDSHLAVLGDRELLLSAVGNLLQNAFKFTKPSSEVHLNAYEQGDRILIEVSDQCGGLPPGGADRMFKPFLQSGEDKSGLGLGLSISRRSVEANKGKLSVRDVPGTGCVFTIDLPRHEMPATGS